MRETEARSESEAAEIQAPQNKNPAATGLSPSTRTDRRTKTVISPNGESGSAKAGSGDRIRRKGNMANDAALIQGVIVISRDGLDYQPLPHTIPDNKLRPYATLLFNRIKADESEAALRKTVADIQIKLGLSVNDHRCKKIVVRAVALIRKNSN